jgi:hypothetical protein
MLASLYITIGMIIICMAYLPDWQIPVMLVTVLLTSSVVETFEE